MSVTSATYFQLYSKNDWTIFFCKCPIPDGRRWVIITKFNQNYILVIMKYTERSSETKSRNFKYKDRIDHECNITNNSVGVFWFWRLSGRFRSVAVSIHGRFSGMPKWPSASMRRTRRGRDCGQRGAHAGDRPVETGRVRTKPVAPGPGLFTTSKRNSSNSSPRCIPTPGADGVRPPASIRQNAPLSDFPVTFARVGKPVTCL